jgi:hypothetical protein
VGGLMRGMQYLDATQIRLPSAARSSGGASGPWDVGTASTLRLTLTVPSISGLLATLDVVLETSHDASSWYTVGQFAQRSAAGSERKAFAGLDRYVRFRWVRGGATPAATFDVAGEAV